MRTNISLIVGIAYIAFMTGMATMVVGDMSSPPELITWTLSLKILLFVGTPFILGYDAGRKSRGY